MNNMCTIPENNVRTIPEIFEKIQMIFNQAVRLIQKEIDNARKTFLGATAAFLYITTGYKMDMLSYENHAVTTVATLEI